MGGLTVVVGDEVLIEALKSELKEAEAKIEVLESVIIGYEHQIEGLEAELKVEKTANKVHKSKRKELEAENAKQTEMIAGIAMAILDNHPEFWLKIKDTVNEGRD